MVRFAKYSERGKLQELWETTFPADAGTDFVSWLFDRRFLPDWCVTAEREGKLAGAVHALPLHMRVRDAILPCAVLCGVATKPEFRGQGVMREMLGELMHALRSRGVPLMPHKPVTLDVYRSVGHYAMSDSQYLTLSADAPRDFSDTCLQADLRADASRLYSCYVEAARRYSGMIDRSFPDFALKLDDYASSLASCVSVEENGRVTGYCVYYEEDGRYGDECVALSADAYRRLFEGVALRSRGEDLCVRVPPDVELSGIESATLPKSVLGVTDVRPLIKAAGLSGGAIAVTDGVVTENNGVFDLSGNPVSRAPQLTISAGRLAQWAVGYRSMAAIVAAGEAAAHDGGIIALMDEAGVRPCFMAEEY